MIRTGESFFMGFFYYNNDDRAVPSLRIVYRLGVVVEVVDKLVRCDDLQFAFEDI